MPAFSDALEVICESSAAQVSCLSGQPRVLATGCGIARTTGLVAIEVTSAVELLPVAAAIRASQIDESGIHTSGAFNSPPACPSAVSVAPLAPASAAARS